MAAIKSVTVLAAALIASPSPVAASMEDLLSVVNTIEHRNSANAELIGEIKSLSSVETEVEAPLVKSATRQQLMAELRGARSQETPKPSATRMELFSELRGAREQMQPKPSATRMEILSELRGAREEMQPKPSAIRQDILSELRAAREQMQPRPSAVRQELISELRAAREMVQPKPSAARQELLAELRSARAQEEAASKPVATPVRSELLAELRDAREQAKIDQFVEELEEPASADELPWDDREEILDVLSVIEATPAEEAASAAEGMDALNKVLRTLLVSGVAFGLAAAAKLPELNMKRSASAPSQWITLALFYAPLALVSADYAFNMAIGNEFGLIAACWGLAAAAAAHLRSQEEKGKIVVM